MAGIFGEFFSSFVHNSLHGLFIQLSVMAVSTGTQAVAVTFHYPILNVKEDMPICALRLAAHVSEDFECIMVVGNRLPKKVFLVQPSLAASERNYLMVKYNN